MKAADLFAYIGLGVCGLIFLLLLFVTSAGAGWLFVEALTAIVKMSKGLV